MSRLSWRALYQHFIVAVLITISVGCLFVSHSEAQPPERNGHIIVAPAGMPCVNGCTGLQAVRSRMAAVGMVATENGLAVQTTTGIVQLNIPSLFPKSREKVVQQNILQHLRGADIDPILARIPDTTSIGLDEAFPLAIAVAKNGDLIWSCMRYRSIFRTKKTADGYGRTELAMPAVDAFHLAVSDDGTIYASDQAGSSVYAIKDGEVERVLGTGKPGSSPDGTPAMQASMTEPAGLAVLPGGRLIVVTAGGLKTISPHGTIETLGAGGTIVPTGSPIPLHEARLDGPGSLRVLGDDIYVLDHPEREKKRALWTEVRKHAEDKRFGKSLADHQDLAPDRIYKISLKEGTIEAVPLKSFRPFINHIEVGADGTLYCVHPGTLTTLREWCDEAIVAYPATTESNQKSETDGDAVDHRSLDQLLESIGEPSTAKRRPKQAASGKDKAKPRLSPASKKLEADSNKDRTPQANRAVASGADERLSDAKGKAKLPGPRLDFDEDPLNGCWISVGERSGNIARRSSCCTNLPHGSTTTELITKLEKSGATLFVPEASPESDCIHGLLSRWLSESDERSGWQKAWDHIYPRHGTMQSAFDWQRRFGEPKSSFDLIDRDGQHLTNGATKTAVRNLIAQLVATKHQSDPNITKTSIHILKSDQDSHWRLVLRGYFKSPIGKTDLNEVNGKIDGYRAHRLDAVFALTPTGLQPITAYPS